MANVAIGAALRHWADNKPDMVAVVCGDRSLTFSQLDRRTNQIARRMQHHNVSAGDWLAIMLPNSTDFVEMAFAAAKLGARSLYVSSKLPPRELKAILALANPTAVIYAEGSHPDVPSSFGPDEAALNQFADAPLPIVRVDRCQAMTSGGSTGRPKVIVSLGANEVDLGNPRLGMRGGETVLVPGPLYHGAPLTYALQSILQGSTAVIMQRFDAEETLALIEKHKANLVLMVPTMMHRIWALAPTNRTKYDLSSLRTLVHMGASCPAWLKAYFIEWLGPTRIEEFYSVTEQLCTTWITGQEWLNNEGSVGRPIRGRIRIIGDDGREVSAGETGEVYMMPDEGPGTTYEYIGASPQRRADGWETTGDLGYVNWDGYLFLNDRRTDMIISGGANIYPAEVESALDEHPDVITSAVIGLPDAEFGHRVHAIIETRAILNEYAMREWVKQRLASYKAPRSFEFVSTPLRSEAGKLRRSALREARLRTI